MSVANTLHPVKRYNEEDSTTQQRKPNGENNKIRADFNLVFLPSYIWPFMVLKNEKLCHTYSMSPTSGLGNLTSYNFSARCFQSGSKLAWRKLFLPFLGITKSTENPKNQEGEKEPHSFVTPTSSLSLKMLTGTSMINKWNGDFWRFHLKKTKTKKPLWTNALNITWVICFGLLGWKYSN